MHPINLHQWVLMDVAILTSTFLLQIGTQYPGSGLEACVDSVQKSTGKGAQCDTTKHTSLINMQIWENPRWHVRYEEHS